MNSIVYLILLSMAAYMIGGIPFGLLVGYAVARKDVRDYGSGNIGMTNVWRTFGPLPGLITLILDAAKGYLPVYAIASVPGFTVQFDPLPVQGLIVVIGMLVILGHNFPVFLGFKGGKGVATGLGVLLAIMQSWLAIPVIIFFLAVAFTRYVSLGSVLGAASVPLVVFLSGDPRFDTVYYPAFTLVVALLVIVRHIPNLKRILKGTENRFEFKPRGSSARVVDWDTTAEKEREN
jgi:glycerol-3-phosphate acyltransferase PlsY